MCCSRKSKKKSTSFCFLNMQSKVLSILKKGSCFSNDHCVKIQKRLTYSKNLTIHIYITSFWNCKVLFRAGIIKTGKKSPPLERTIKKKISDKSYTSSLFSKYLNSKREVGMERRQTWEKNLKGCKNETSDVGMKMFRAQAIRVNPKVRERKRWIHFYKVLWFSLWS